MMNFKLYRTLSLGNVLHHFPSSYSHGQTIFASSILPYQIILMSFWNLSLHFDSIGLQCLILGVGEYISKTYLSEYICDPNRSKLGACRH